MSTARTPASATPNPLDELPGEHRGPRGVSAPPDRLRAAAVIVGVLGLTGALCGLVWSWLVPRVDVVVTDLGPFPVSEGDAARLVQMDGWYAVLAAGAGVLLGAVLGAIFLRYGIVTVGALLVGAVLAAGLSLGVGTLMADGEVVFAWAPQAELGTELPAPLSLHAYGVLLVWPIAVLAPLLPLAWFSWWPESAGAGSAVHPSEVPDSGVPPEVR